MTETRRSSFLATGDPVADWYIATVWVEADPTGDSLRYVIRSLAFDVEDYQARVRKQFPAKHVVTFGPISQSKRQQ